MAQSEAVGDSGLHVLLVEDNRLNQELIGDLLALAGHRVDIVEDGEQLRRRIATGEAPDVILLDVLLPGGSDGVMLLGELRRLQRMRLTPVLAVTAQALAPDLARFAAAGFDAIITKPIDTRTFVAEVEKYAGGGSRHH
jgi:CheY-like chemotaxis protein